MSSRPDTAGAGPWRLRDRDPRHRRAVPRLYFGPTRRPGRRGDPAEGTEINRARVADICLADIVDARIDSGSKLAAGRCTSGVTDDER